MGPYLVGGELNTGKVALVSHTEACVNTGTMEWSLPPLLEATGLRLSLCVSGTPYATVPASEPK